MKVLYYYYYLFYTKIIPDDQPNATVIFVLSFCSSFLFMGITDIISNMYFSYSLSKYQMLGIFIAFVIKNYFVFYRSGKYKRIIEDKPMFFNSHKISILLTLLYAIITISSLFWAPVVVKDIIDARKLLL